MLSVENLSIHLQTNKGVLQVVDDLNYSLAAGETLGIVGESGSGKSVSCYALLGLLPKAITQIKSGTANFMGQNLLSKTEAELRSIRGLEISMIFQDPMTCLNPYLKVLDQVAEPLIIHQKITKKEARRQAITALEEVGLNEAWMHDAYVHEFSGGMRQRVMIAMALITKPKLLIADEPTTALDATIQGQVLDLIKQRQHDLGTAMILVTHDLGLVAHYCDQVQVMYAGQLVERASAQQLLKNPQHAYTRALMRTLPENQQEGEPLLTIPGSTPDLHQPAIGCRFAPRNTLGDAALCLSDAKPQWNQLQANHWVQDCPGCLTTVKG